MESLRTISTDVAIILQEFREIKGLLLIAGSEEGGMTRSGEGM